MRSEQVTKKKSDKSDLTSEQISPPGDVKKSNKSCESEEPKPRIVLTFRSEKPGAKSSSMKIVTNEEKQEEVSPRRAVRSGTSKWDTDDETEVLSVKKEKSQPVSENDETSDGPHHQTTKRSMRRRSKDFSDNILANAIARKEKIYNDILPETSQRSARQIKELKRLEMIKFETDIVISIEDGVKTRRTARRSDKQSTDPAKEVKQEIADPNELEHKIEVDTPCQDKKLKHLGGLGLKAKTLDDDDDDDEDEEEDIEIKEIELEDEDEMEEDEEVISKLLEADAESTNGNDSSDEDFYCSTDASQNDRPKRSRRATRQSFGQDVYEIESEELSQTADEGDKAPKRRSSRKYKFRDSYSVDENYSPPHKKGRSSKDPVVELDLKPAEEIKEESNPAAAEEGGEAECPESDEGKVVACCTCEQKPTLHAHLEDTSGPVFCQAVSLVDGARAGCSQLARGLSLRRAGVRAPLLLTCALHAQLLRAHACCPACGLFCMQGTFYQCSRGHLFNVECALYRYYGKQWTSGKPLCQFGGPPHTDAKAPPGCPHCGVLSYRWLPVNTECTQVTMQMHTDTKQVMLPEQRVQSKQAYIGFTINPSVESDPIIPKDLLPSTPIDVEALSRARRVAINKISSEESILPLIEAIEAGLSVEKLLPMIVSVADINQSSDRLLGGSCAHLAAGVGAWPALHALRLARADLDRLRPDCCTPLVLALQALVELSKKAKKSDSIVNSKEPELEDININEEPESDIDKSAMSISENEPIKNTDLGNEDGVKTDKADGEVKEEKAAIVVEEKANIAETSVPKNTPKEEDLMRVIRYLVAAGCDLNIAGPEGMTALHIAAQNGLLDAAALLLSSSQCEVDPKDHGGWTPLVLAAENGHATLVELLLKHGADATSTDNEGNAAIHWCCLQGSCAALLLLLQGGAHGGQLNAHSDTPLHIAARQGHYACVTILLARGARTDAVNSAGQLPAEVCTDECQRAIALSMKISEVVGAPIARVPLVADLSCGREKYPIPCINEIDDEAAPEDFTYVTSLVMPKHIFIDNTIDTAKGCACEEASCGAKCSCSALGVRSWLRRGRLLPNFPYHEPPMLFHCNQTCSCDQKKCQNRDISRLIAECGATFVRTAVARTASRGWGLVALAPVARGTPVALYCGELVTAADADCRAADHYMFGLDVKPDLLEQCADKTVLCVDAAQFGSAARFVNHGCDANLVPLRVFADVRDLRLPHIVLAACKDIAKGEELTFDYGDKFWSVKSKWMKCECGSMDCRYPVKCEAEVE